MPDKPGAQFQDHPHMAAGRAAMPHRLADYADFQFLTQCPSPACRFRRFPVAPVVAARFGITATDALARLCCRDNSPLPRLWWHPGGVASLALPARSRLIVPIVVKARQRVAAF
jgi:hypothetical protein